jgi:ADP-heptose:LPS heptosyltransferase
VKPNQSPPPAQFFGHGDHSSLLPRLPEGSEILIIRLRSLGDLVLETPGIAALKAWRPDLRISVLVEPRFAAVLQGNPAITELLRSGGLGATSLELRRRRFSAVFNQHGGPRSAALTGASGSPSRIGWKGYQYSFLYNVQVPDAEEFYGRAGVHTVEHRLSQFYWTGLPRGPIPATQIFPQPDAQHSVAQKLAEKGISSRHRYAVLQPGARLAGMHWPVSKFAGIARWLKTSYGIVSVVNCGAREESVASEVRKEMRDCAIVPDQLDIRELVALISGARLFVGNDSGPAHIASALQRPTVVIFGQTDPAQWRPLHFESRIVSTGAEFDHPRGDKALVMKEPRPISSIALDEVREACAQLLGAELRAPAPLSV